MLPLLTLGLHIERIRTVLGGFPLRPELQNTLKSFSRLSVGEGPPVDVSRPSCGFDWTHGLSMSAPLGHWPLTVLPFRSAGSLSAGAILKVG